MVVQRSTPVLLIAVVVFLVWRTLLWRRAGGDFLREIGVWVLFIWALAVVQLTFFPMIVIFYDWASGVNLIPLASIRLFLNHPVPGVAFDNLVGNVAMFVPLGMLLPLLFSRVRTWADVLWRAAVVSAAIELVQFVTGARATDVDDVILNSLGALIGFGLYKIAAAVARRSEAGSRVLDRLDSESGREPLTTGLVPIGITLALSFPILLMPLIGGTLGEDGMLDDATSQLGSSAVLSRFDSDEHTFVLVGTSGPSPTLVAVGYERAMPGRFTRVVTTDPVVADGSRYSWTITAYNPQRGETPSLVVWGWNDAGASTLHLSGNGLDEDREIDDGPFVVIADIGDQANLEDFGFVFLDADGRDVTEEFSTA